jgi:electron transfer flavoprotein alpha subunit
VVGARPTVATVLPFMEGAPAGDDEAEVIVVPAPDADLRVLIESARSGAAPLSLSEARVIVTGGAGLSSPEDFAVLGELARLLGGVVAATPTACDRGHAPRELCITRTPERPAPALYFSFAASGSVEHLRALRGSPVIVAVDRERTAPIFKVARYGIVGDAMTVARELVTELSQRPPVATRRETTARAAVRPGLSAGGFVDTAPTLSDARPPELPVLPQSSKEERSS